VKWAVLPVTERRWEAEKGALRARFKKDYDKAQRGSP
jgi:hypothetical protein